MIKCTVPGCAKDAKSVYYRTDGVIAEVFCEDHLSFNVPIIAIFTNIQRCAEPRCSEPARMPIFEEDQFCVDSVYGSQDYVLSGKGGVAGMYCMTHFMGMITKYFRDVPMVPSTTPKTTSTGAHCLPATERNRQNLGKWVAHGCARAPQTYAMPFGGPNTNIPHRQENQGLGHTTSSQNVGYCVSAFGFK